MSHEGWSPTQNQSVVFCCVVRDMDIGQPTRRDAEPSGRAGSEPPRTPTTIAAQGGPPMSLRSPRRARLPDQSAEYQLSSELSRPRPGDAGRKEPETPRAPQVQSRAPVTTPQSEKPVPQGSGSPGPPGPPGSGPRSPISTRAAPLPQLPPSLPEDTQFTAHQQRAGTTDIQAQPVEDFRFAPPPLPNIIPCPSQ